MKVFLLSTFAVLIAVGILLSTPDGPRDGLIGMPVAGLITSLILISFNAFDPARWFQGRFAFANAVLVGITAKGFESYFYLTESELAVRAPFEASLRHYRWDDVVAVSLGCRSSRKGPRFRYVLRLSDARDIDFDRVPPRRLAPVFERLTSRLDSLSGVRYEFDISEDALAEFGREHGAGLENAIRSQVQRHGGVAQH